MIPEADKLDLRKLKDLKASVSDMNARKIFDAADKEYPNKVSRIVNDHFTDMINQLSRSQNYKQIRQQSYLSGDLLRKIKKVTAAYCMELSGKYADLFPDICVEEQISMLMSTVHTQNYDTIDFENYFSQAAALYILDHFPRSSLKYIIRYLPKDEESLAFAVYNDETIDACHSEEVIRSLIYLIQNENKSLKKHDPFTMYLEDAMVKRELSGINEDMDPETLNENQKLRCIFSLMNQNDIKRSVSHFKDDVFDFIQAVLKIISEYQKTIDKKHETIIRKIENEIRKREKRSLLMMEEKTENSFDTYLKILSMIEENEEGFKKESDLLYDSINLYNYHYRFSDKKAEEKLCRLEVGNPFETCFAFVYLYTMNDDLIYLVNACIPVLKMAAEKLPWNKGMNMALETEELYEEEDDFDLEEREKWLEEQIEEIRKDMEEHKEEYAKQKEDLERDFYALKYNDSANYPGRKIDEADLQRLNFPQLVHMLSGGIVIPRNVYSNSGLKEDLLGSGLKEDQTRLFELYLELADSLRTRTDFDLPEEEDDAPVSKENEKEEVLEDKNKKLEEENKRLKQLILEKNKTIESERSRYRKLEKEYQKEKEERLLLQKEIGRSEQKGQKGEGVDLPYQVRRKILIFGGNAGWQNAIKEMLKDVKITETDKLPDLNAIRNADEIWIQTRSFSHKYFYRISEAASRYEIPVKYFLYSGAEKCAVQLAEEDRKGRS